MKKKVDKKHEAYSSKGMRQKDGDKMKMDASKEVKEAPKHKPSRKKSHPQASYKMPKGGEQSMAPEHKKRSLTKEHAPEGVSGVNEGEKMSLPKSGGRGDSEV